tara:strand:- start:2834 stop:3385 length:552 start_codon:yes stop_codon:yes gene_type:complete
MILEDEQNNLAERLLMKLAKAGTGETESTWEKARAEIGYYIKQLQEYELNLLSHWITSYQTDNKLWYKYIYGLILEAKVKLYLRDKTTRLKVENKRLFTKAKIERAKQKIQCEDVATANGVALRRRGQNLVGSCPFHEDKTPSFTIFPDNHFKCFGSCGRYGDSVTLLDYMNKEGTNYGQQIR